MITGLAVVAAALAACGGAHATAPAARAFDPEPVIVAGAFPADRGPDGNSVILDAPDGLIVVDTGRHPEHQDALLAHARRVGKPLAVIVNTHWHLDHSGGNAEVRDAYPQAELVATNAVDGALTGFFPASQREADAFLASGHASAAQREDIELGRAAIADTANLRPTRAITRSGTVELAGRALELHVAPFAATEADLWIYDPATRTVIAGDLVVAPVPFFDTGCPDGWRAALADIAATPFARLIPGHGEPMTRADFDRWRAGFEALVACAASTTGTSECAARWRTAAAPFIAPGDEARIDEYTGYYVQEILRSPTAHERFCHPLH